MNRPCSLSRRRTSLQAEPLAEEPEGGRQVAHADHRVQVAHGVELADFGILRSMSEPNVLVNFRLDRERPMRIKWLATDGVPGDGYKAQVTSIRLARRRDLEMDSSAILEQTAPDPSGGIGGYLVTFNGMVGYAADHPDRARIDQLTDDEIGYELVFVHDDEGRLAVEGEDYEIRDRPRGDGAHDQQPPCVTTRPAARRSGSRPRVVSACCCRPTSGSPTIPYGMLFGSPRGREADRAPGRPPARPDPRASRPGSSTCRSAPGCSTTPCATSSTPVARQLVLLGAGYDTPRAAHARARRGRRVRDRPPRDAGPQARGPRPRRRRVARALRRPGTSRPRPLDELPRRARRRRPRPDAPDPDDLGGRDDVPDRGRDRRLAARDRRWSAPGSRGSR